MVTAVYCPSWYSYWTSCNSKNVILVIINICIINCLWRTLIYNIISINSPNLSWDVYLQQRSLLSISFQLWLLILLARTDTISFALAFDLHPSFLISWTYILTLMVGGGHAWGYHWGVLSDYHSCCSGRPQSKVINEWCALAVEMHQGQMTPVDSIFFFFKY